MQPSPDECAREVLEVIPSVMRYIRAEVRRHRTHDLSVPQFRALGFINRNPGTQLSALAEHLGLTPPSASKLVDGLVRRQLVERQPSSTDRRCITLHLTLAGKTLIQASYQASQAAFSRLFAGLAENERTNIIQSMYLFRQVFAGSDVLKILGGEDANP
jgi:DNA-binding MarR family transcriptional regulator